MTDDKPPVTDPRLNRAVGPIAGEVEGEGPDIDYAVLLEGVGVALVGTGRLADDGDLDESSVDLRLALSLIGRVNHSSDEVHHAYIVEPSTLGLLIAQLLWLASDLGPEVHAAFLQRQAELAFRKEPDA